MFSVSSVDIRNTCKQWRKHSTHQHGKELRRSQGTVIFQTFIQLQYAILLSMVLVLHVATAIAGLMLGVCRSKEIVSDTLTAFMHSYDYDTVLRETMDWTQLKVKKYLYSNEPLAYIFNSTSTTVAEITDQMTGSTTRNLSKHQKYCQPLQTKITLKRFR